MGDKSAIQWTDATWNPLRGCSIVSKGCRSCYAMKQAHRFSGRGQAYDGLTKLTRGGPVWTGKVRTVPDLLDQPLRWKRPRRVFVNSMSDLFHEDVPEKFIIETFAVMLLAQRHTFQILTKRPERMLDVVTRIWASDYVNDVAAKFMRYEDMPDVAVVPPANIWLGVSCEDQATANERIPLLLQTPAAVRFVSAEPLLGPIDFQRWLPVRRSTGLSEWVKDGERSLLDWIIVGGESGPGARPFNVEWARSIIGQCKAAGVACFVKQLGAHVMTVNDAGFEGDTDDSWPMDTRVEDWDKDPSRQYQGAPCRVYLRDRKGGDMQEWPADLQVREFPR